MSEPGTTTKTMLTPRGVVSVVVGDAAQSEEIMRALIAEARKQNMLGREVPVIVFQPGKEPYFCVAEDDAPVGGAATGKAGDV